MLYRRLGKTEETVPILGYGCMRFEVIDNDPAKIDEREAIKQIRHGIDRGITYLDTAYPYHNGMSEPLVAKALKGGYREKVKVATKLPSWLIKSPEDMDRILNEQLDKLETQQIDFYLVHTLDQTLWTQLKSFGLLEFLERIKADGRVKHVGFSFHDELPVFKQIIDEYDWSFCQIQYNFMDVAYQAGTEGMEYAHKKDLGIIVMEPLRGGSLVKNIPNDVQSIWDSAKVKRSPAEWALRFIWNRPEVAIVLSGMNSLEQIDENADIASAVQAGELTDRELKLIEQAREIYLERMAVNCTNCKYCMPCPYEVDIPGNFAFLNNAAMYQDTVKFKRHLKMFIPEKSRASACKECGVCVEKCPQHINIPMRLKEVASTLEA